MARDVGLMEGLNPFIAEDEFGYIPRDKVVVILTGSQGESRAALAKIARDEMRNVAFTAGDTVVFSSRAIPGNEKAINDIKNGLVEQGIHIVTDYRSARACFRPPPPPRAAADVRMDTAADPRAGSWRGGASDGTGGTRPAIRHQDRSAGAQWRYPAARARSGNGDRHGARMAASTRMAA